MKPMLLIFTIVALVTGNVKTDFKKDESKSFNSKFHKAHNPESNISPYIDGGTEVDPITKYPFLVILYIDFNNNCNGALISDEWVLTAAHCLFGAFTVDVHLGEHDLSTIEDTEVTIHASEYIVHEGYDATTISNDIALVHLESKVKFTEAINVVALPSVNDEDLGIGVDVTIIGWRGMSYKTGHPIQVDKGSLQRKQRHSFITRKEIISQVQDGDQRGALTNTAYEVTVNTVSNSECSSVYGASLVQADKLCTSHTNGGADSTDSGSPVIYNSVNGIQLRGIVSTATSVGNSLPDMHTRVTHYLNWIQANTGL